MDVNSFNESNLLGNKSFSAPDISKNGPLFRRRCVIIEDHFFPHSGSPFSPISSSPACASTVLRRPNITRHTSCEHLALAFQSTPNESTASIITNQDEDPMPMDIDQVDSDSNEANNNLQVEELPIEMAPKQETRPKILDFVDLTYQGTTRILKKRRQRTPKKQPMAMSNYTKIKINIALVIILIISVPIYDRLNYNRSINIQEITTHLNNHLIAQNNAIMHITKALNLFNNNALDSSQRLILSMIGTTGVGKTHCVNIIKRQFMPKQTIEIDIDKHNVDKDSIDLYKSVPYLVIFDDLVYKDLPKLSQILKTLPDNKWILVVAVFNVQETDDVKLFTVNEQLYSDIPAELARLDYSLEVVNFESFTWEILRDNLDKIVAEFNLTSLYLNRNFEDLLSKHDFATVGFKGLVEKLNLIN